MDNFKRTLKRRVCPFRRLIFGYRDQWKMVLLGVTVLILLVITNVEIARAKYYEEQKVTTVSYNITNLLALEEFGEMFPIGKLERIKTADELIHDLEELARRVNISLDELDGLNDPNRGRRVPRALRDQNKKPPYLTLAGLQTSQKIIYALTKFRSQQVVVLVNDDPELYQVTLAFMYNILHNTNVRSDFSLMTYNDSGASGTILNTTQDKTGLLTLLKERSKVNYYASKSYIGPKTPKHPATFFAIIKATQMVPKNSAIILITDEQPEDEALSSLTKKWMFKLNVSLFVLWAGITEEIEAGGRILSEIAQKSGGRMFIVNSERNMSALNDLQHLQSWESRATKQLLLVQHNLKGLVNFSMVIDATITKVHFLFSSRLMTALLTSERGIKLNLLDSKSVEKFSSGSFIAHDPGMSIDVQLNIAHGKGVPKTGIWKLTTSGIAGYNVTVFAITNIGIIREYNTHGNSTRSEELNTSDDKTISFRLKGDIVDIDNVSIVDESGNEIDMESNLTYKCTPVYKVQKTGAKKFNRKLVLDVSNILDNTFYIKVNGNNKNGDEFSRISFVDVQMSTQNLPAIVIEINPTSHLIVKQGKVASIIFDITNNRDHLVYLYFVCRDQKSMLQNIQPNQAWIAPRQTISVQVAIFTWATPATTNVEDVLTFSADGEHQAEKSVILHITDDNKPETDLPDMYYTFTSSCNEISSSKCYTGTWTIQVVAQDTGSGLLMLGSSPPGLIPKDNFVSGTKEPVTAYYTSTCCKPLLKIFAIDLQQNRRTIDTDANHANLSVGSTSAIVVGVLLFIVLMCILGVYLYKKCKKNDRNVLSVYHRSADPTSDTGL